MTDKHSIKYSAFIDKESGNMVCQQLNCNYSIQVYDMAQNMSAIFINTSPNPQSQIEFYANNSTNTASQTYSNCNLGINENNFYLYNMNGGTIWNTDLLANISTFYMPLNVADTFTANNVNINSTLNVDQSVNVTNTLTANSANISTTLTAQQVICSPATQGAALHIYGDPYYSAELAFMTGTDKLFEVGTTTTNVSPSTGNFFFIYNNQNSTYSVQIITGSQQTINLNGDVNVYGGLGVSDNVTVNNTLTANNIVATGMQLNVTGDNPQGLSIIGVTGSTPSADATQIFFQSNANGVLTTHWQLGPAFDTANPPDFWLYNNIGKYNTLQIHASTPLIDIYTSINVTGSVTLSGSLTANNIVVTGATITTLTAQTVNITPLTNSYGGSSGYVYLLQPFTGPHYKKVFFIFRDYTPSSTNVTFDFPVAFTTQFAVTSNPLNFDHALLGNSIELENLSTTATYNGGLTIEGY